MSERVTLDLGTKYLGEEDFFTSRNLLVLEDVLRKVATLVEEGEELPILDSDVTYESMLRSAAIRILFLEKYKILGEKS